jgi:hypothetical protein
VAGVYLTLQVVVLSNDILKYVDTKNPTLSLIVMIVGFAMYSVKPFVRGNREPSHSAIRRHSLGSATFSQFKEFTIGERTLSHMVTS